MKFDLTTISGGIRSQWYHIPPVESFAPSSLAGKTIIVTGANTGLGLEAARHIALLHPSRLILACRNVEAGNEARESILSTLKANGKVSGESKIEVIRLDLGSLAGVTDFADRWAKDEKGQKIDVLLENAGINTGTYFRMSTDGYESMVQVNVLSTFLLGVLMAPYLRLSSSPRLVIVSSLMHLWIKEPLPSDEPSIYSNLSSEEYSSQTSKSTPPSGKIGPRYSLTKLMEIMLVPYLDEALSSSAPNGSGQTNKKIIIGTVDPGMCHSNLTKDMNSIAVRLLKAIFARTAEEGSKTLVHTAIADQVEKAGSAKHWASCDESDISTLVATEKGRAFSKELWFETLKILQDADPRVKNILG